MKKQPKLVKVDTWITPTAKDALKSDAKAQGRLYIPYLAEILEIAAAKLKENAK